MHVISDRRYRIPTAFNLFAVAVCTALYFILMYAASHAASIAGMLTYAGLFAVVMVPVYSLIHEAEHNMLHPRPAWNGLLGRWLCLMFVVSFTFLTHCHLRHHVKNRTDIEMWDLYREDQSKWKRRGNLYLMMCGLGYFSLWLSVVLFALRPPLVYCGFLQRHTEIAGFLEGSEQPSKLGATRIESWAVLIFQGLMIWALHLQVLVWLLLFLIHGFVWSSQVYVNHAFSSRDIYNGAHNLKMPAWLTPIYLNFNLHLAHHQNPQIPWIHLRAFVQPQTGRINFFWNYLRLWTGPRLTHEPNPSGRSPVHPVAGVHTDEFARVAASNLE
jgi:fatty acid desaturase